MIANLPNLPVQDVLNELDHALAKQCNAVLVAPPGAGKTTIVPLHLINADWCKDKMIILLEPRRLAARSAAQRMASLLGEQVGETVGYRMRLDTKASKKTRILVVTEGVFSRMILDDPELTGVAAILFDEFHERSLDADFGLALALDVANGLRPDLRLLVMSATLDGARIAKLLNSAPIIESKGRSFPVQLVYQPRKPDQKIEEAVANAISYWAKNEAGSILAFLPGQSEIKRTANLLNGKLPDNMIIAPLYGAMEGREQDIAIRPAKSGKRKVVLATSIAESSLTIDGVNIVIDSGLSRVPIFEPATGITRLVTVKASRASVDQRAGRAGRTSPGIAVRLWHEGQTSSLPDYSQPEILSADLANMVLDSAAFGITDINQLTFLDSPPKAAQKEAVLLLEKLSALDKDGPITPLGEAIRQKALPVRLSAMLIQAEQNGEAQLAAELAIVLTERGLGGMDVDLEKRITNFRHDHSERANKARILIKRLIGKNDFSSTPPPAVSNAARLLLTAWPDRVAKTRGNSGRFLAANGRGMVIDELSPLAKAKYLVVADVTGSAEQSRILAATEIDEETIRDVLHDKIENTIELNFDVANKAFRARDAQSLGAIQLSEKPYALPNGDEANRAIIAAIREHGLKLLPWTKETISLRQRLDWIYRGLGAPWPQMSDDVLLDNLEEWLLPFLSGEAKFQSLSVKTIHDGLISLVPYTLQREIDKKAPTHYTVPTGSHIPINYEGEEPLLSVRVQELFGLTQHPAIADGTIPLVLELLSPAHRPIQITKDLPKFWQGSWSDIRADMRGRYPKHPWPENPMLAEPTKRAKPRNS